MKGGRPASSQKQGPGVEILKKMQQRKNLCPWPPSSARNPTQTQNSRFVAARPLQPRFDTGTAYIHEDNIFRHERDSSMLLAPHDVTHAHDQPRTCASSRRRWRRASLVCSTSCATILRVPGSQTGVLHPPRFARRGLARLLSCARAKNLGTLPSRSQERRRPFLAMNLLHMAKNIFNLLPKYYCPVPKSLLVYSLDSTAFPTLWLCAHCTIRALLGPLDRKKYV